MKSIIFLFFASIFFTNASFAQDLIIEESCLMSSGNNFVIDKSLGGLSCEKIKAMTDAFSVIGLALSPVTAVLASSSIKMGLAQQLQMLGIAATEATVASVTLIGAIGVTTFYVILRAKISECQVYEREQLKRELLDELANKYNLNSNGNVSIKVSR